ncbi:MAG: UbiA prenyltransferase family protein [Lachnospiraceae bacterium]|nr:UbiA prenyltransferase family protein [Lachnospiraceae bacterium]
MRIKSWLKNLFVFCPIIFSLELFEWNKLMEAIVLTLAFCLVSSAIYVLNDINDFENDRKHEVKKNRPIASGQIPFSHAWILLVCLMIVGSGMALWVNLHSFILILTYTVINILYSKWLKTMVLIDCFCIAAGFLLRVMVGGTIVSDGVSDWMFLTVLALSLFMSFGKRRGELHSYTDGETREVLEIYEKNFLDGIVFMCAGLSMVFYSLWAVSQKSNLIYTVPIVLFIVIRYLLLVFKGRAEADPTTLILSDKTLLISCGICAVIMVAMLYGTQIF